MEEFRRFAAAPASVIEGALLVGRVIDARQDSAWCRGEIVRLAALVHGDARAVVAGLRRAGFAGASDYYVAANSSLEYVLRQRRGIPISLACVVIGVAEQLGLSASGINFPRHFLVELDGRLVDPFAMQITTRADCEAWLRAHDLALADAFNPASPIDIVVRMLNNLRVLAHKAHDAARVLELTDCQLALVPRVFALHVVRVDAWLELGVINMARHELEQAIELAPDATIRSELANRLTQLAARPSQLH